MQGEQLKEQIFKSVESIVDESDPASKRDLIDKFVVERTQVLVPESLSSIPPVSYKYSRYIGQETEIQPQALVSGFRMDDPEIYHVFFDALTTYKNTPGYSEHRVRDLVPHAILRANGTYFGNMQGTETTTQNRLDLYDDEPISILEHKNNNSAECTEKATFAHNILKLLGYDDELVFALCTFDEEVGAEFHAYNLTESNGRHVLLDYTNPVTISNTEGQVVNYMPSVYRLSEDQKNELLKNGELELEHFNYQQTEDGRLEPSESTKRTYRYPTN